MMILRILKTIDSIIREQNNEGFWQGTVSSPPITNIIYILFIQYLNLNHDEKYRITIKKLSDYILSVRNSNGFWSLYDGGESDISLTLLCYFALKLSSTDINNDYMLNIRSFIIENHKNVKRLNIWDEILLTIMGQIPLSIWTRIPKSITLMPEILPCYLDFPALLKPQIIILSTVLNEDGIFYPNEKYNLTEYKGIFGINPGHNNKNQSNKIIKKRINGILKYFSPYHKVFEWLKKYRDYNGLWYGNTSITLFALAALKNIDKHILIDSGEYKNLLEQGLKGIEELSNHKDEGIFQPEVNCAIWDTANMVRILQNVDRNKANINNSISKGINYLLSKQRLNETGIWKRHNKNGISGGWAFESNNHFSPDADDTSLVLSVLKKEGLSHTYNYMKGLSWLLSNRNNDGGFPLFEKKGKWIYNLDPFFRLLTKNYPMYLNESLPEMSARIGNILLELGFDKKNPEIKKLINYFRKSKNKRHQKILWESVWFTNYIFGSASVYRFLLKCEENIDKELFEINDWFNEIRNNDGGWGEDPLSHKDKRYINFKSSPLLTTEVLLFKMEFLLNKNIYLRNEINIVKKGLKYLLKNQNSNGYWEEPTFVNNYIPKLGWHCNFGLSTKYYPLTIFLKIKEILGFKSSNV